MDKIALEGAINGCDNSTCNEWRQLVIRELSGLYVFHNPMDFDCRGRERELRDEIVKYDEHGMATSDIILVNAVEPSWGTAIGIGFCWSLQKKIITICEDNDPSPWLSDRSTVMVTSVEEAIKLLRDTSAA